MDSGRTGTGNGNTTVKSADEHFRLGIHIIAIRIGFTDVMENLLGPFNRIGIAENRRLV